MGSKVRRREQASKAQKASVRDNATTRGMILDPRGGLRGRQALATDYRRKPKHAGRGWEE